MAALIWLYDNANIVMVYKDEAFVENHRNKDLEAGQAWKEVVLGQDAVVFSQEAL